MVIIQESKTFKKHFKLRVSTNQSLRKKFFQRLDLFMVDKENPLLKDHKLEGQFQGLRSFSITGDIRVLYRYESQNTILFLDVGSHNQVYK